MSFLVDTNVFVELAKPKPSAPVVAWLRENEAALYISSITIGEIRRGVEQLPNGPRRKLLSAWLAELCQKMGGRILSFNTSTTHVWGQLKAKWEQRGLTIPSLDSQIAATAVRHQLILVTRNERDFEDTGLELLNPFA